MAFILFLKPQYWYVCNFEKKRVVMMIVLVVLRFIVFERSLFDFIYILRIDFLGGLRRLLNLLLNLTKNWVERIGQKIIWQIRPISVTIWLYISTDSISGGLSFRNLEN